MTWDLGAFAVEEPIGRGGAATVWRGRHRRSGLPVAIKVLDVAEPQEAEVRAVAGLDHPNVVLLFDHGVLPDGSGRPWLAMELARGTLANAAPLPWPDLRDVLERLLSALAHAHARGVFHLDLKPANVLLGCRRGEWEPAEDPLSGLRLADFGIARRVRTGERDPAHGAIVGTPAYMAPEQARGQRHRTGPWTDLYALACTAWELASGAPPFDGDSPTEILQAHVVREPPPLRNRVPVPAGFAGWLAWLLEKEPRDRALRAADAAEALRALPEDDWVEPVAATAPAPAGDTLRLDGADLPASARSPRPRRGGPPPFRAGWREPDGPPLGTRVVDAGLGLFGLRMPPMVAREAERDAAWDVLADVVVTGKAGLVAFRGPAGTGKSRLAAWIAERAQELGLGHAVYARHNPVPVAGDGLAGAIGLATRAAGLDRDAAIERLEESLACAGVHGRWLPEALAARLAEVGGAPTVDTLALSLIREAGAFRTVVLVIDDAQWGEDALSLADQVLATREQDPLRVLLVLTLRDDALAERPVAARIAARLLARPGAREIVVGPLDDDAQELLVCGHLGLDRALADRVAERAAGSPLFAVQLVGHWVARGQLVPGPGGFVAAPGADLGLPDGLHALWLERLAPLLADPVARVALERAAALGTEVADAEWRAVATVPDGLAERLLATCLALPTPRGWAFAHGMIRESLERHARAHGHWEGHHRAAAAMLRGRPDAEGREGRHLFAGGDPAAAAAPLLRAASAHAARAEHRLAQAAATLAGEALARAGVPAADPAWGRQRAVEVEVLAGRGRVDEVAAKGERLLADATDAGWTDVLPDVLAHLAWARRHRGDPSEAAGLAERARDLWAAAGEARRELRSAAELAAIYLALGRALEAEATARAILPVATARGWADLVARALVVLANLHEYAGRFEEAEADGRRALDLALSVGDEAVAARAARRVVGALVALGRVAEAEGLQRETVERSRRLGVTHGLAMDRNLLGEILRRRGDLVEAARWYADSLDLCRRLGADPVIPSLNLAQVYLTLGEAADALAIVEGVLARDPEGLQRIGARVIGVAVAARTGDVERFGAWWPGLGEELARARYADPDFAALLGRAADDLAARGDPRAEEVRAVALAQAAATHRDTPVGPPGAPPTAISS